ncbi:hypothetical protein L1987_00381 [Smallanthus sonchifolius]|uniref:Uncharacterized protein n=1 Tax=Smallanthus sonchifolius TaxID=185202 RepID=A0ACB9K236_9ASTR|nr:hypothetical protein L1987_00381 [Smallanthus sonchifolius]
MIQLFGVSSLPLSQSALWSNMNLAASRAGDRLSSDGDTKSSSCVDSTSGCVSSIQVASSPRMTCSLRSAQDLQVVSEPWWLFIALESAPKSEKTRH